MAAPAARAALRWTAQGTTLFETAVAALPDAALDAPSGLPGWSRRHLLAHVAANAEAVGRLASWAGTGVETPMYASAGARAEEIEVGARRPADDLRHWVSTASAELERSFDRLDGTTWTARVRTAQGRLVPATELPWLRAREVLVHTVDLAAGATFALLPADFLRALVEDVTARRSQLCLGPALTLRTEDDHDRWVVRGVGPVQHVVAPLAEVAAWLAGRPHGLTSPPVPALPPWL